MSQCVAGKSLQSGAQERKIYVSVGRTSTPTQEEFVQNVEDRLRAEDLTPCTVGRNMWTADAPLKAVMELMAECVGVVVIAFERKFFPKGVERRGHPEAVELQDVSLPTPFNQVEAAMAYCYGHPLLIIKEEGLWEEGLLEKGNDWRVLTVKLTPAALTTPEFNQTFASWKKYLTAPRGASQLSKPLLDPERMTIAQLLGSLRPAQMWSVMGAITVLVAGAFSLGANLLPGP
jgi:hypothetical protein